MFHRYQKQQEYLFYSYNIYFKKITSKQKYNLLKSGLKKIYLINYKQQTTNNKQQTTNNKQQTTNNKLNKNHKYCFH